MDPFTLLSTIPFLGPFIPYLTGAVTVASVLATVLPPPKVGASSPYQALYHLVVTFSLAFGHAANAPAFPASPVLPAPPAVLDIPPAVTEGVKEATAALEVVKDLGLVK